MNEKTKMRLVIDVDYELGKARVEDLHYILKDAADHLANEGLLSGEADAEVLEWHAYTEDEWGMDRE